MLPAKLRVSPAAHFLIFMGKIFQLLYFLVLLLHLPGSLPAQKEDYNWLLGGTISDHDSLYYRSCVLDFNTTPLSITTTPKQLPFDFTNTSICDSFGKLLCFSNGENVYNYDHMLIENGEDFYPNYNYIEGFPMNQSFILLPWPGHTDKVIYIYGRPKVIGSLGGYVKFLYTIIDMKANGGLGEVINRDITISVDTVIVGQMTATRHGNGRDWWVIVPRFDGDLVSVQNVAVYPEACKAIRWGKGVIFLDADTKSAKYSKAEIPSFLAVPMMDK